MKLFLKILLSAVTVFMIYEIIDTSLESNLFKELDYLAGIPWMEATLYDFYANVLCIFLWVSYKETKLVKKIFWLIMLCLLGSPMTCIYILKELFLLKPNEDFSTLLTRQNA